MKRIILCAALLVGCVTFANAWTISSETVSTVQITDNDYKEVALADLSQVVQNAVKELAGEDYDVKKVEFNAEKEFTKVTFLKTEDNTEKVVILNKEGKEVKE